MILTRSRRVPFCSFSLDIVFDEVKKQWEEILVLDMMMKDNIRLTTSDRSRKKKICFVSIFDVFRYMFLFFFISWCTDRPCIHLSFVHDRSSYANGRALKDVSSFLSSVLLHIYIYICKRLRIYIYGEREKISEMSRRKEWRLISL